MFKKVISVMMAVMMSAAIFTGCGGNNTTTEGTTDGATEGGSTGEAITVCSREDGSGTRGAFVELFGIEQEDESGEKVDMTIPTAEITNSTSVMITTIVGNKNAIGYISLGSLDESKVKALKIDGAEPTVENINAGTYKVSRPFNIAVREDVSEAAQDFISFILSSDGQAVVEEKGYIKASDAEAYTPSGVTGKITVAGSSSVNPVMEKLAEAYEALNEGVNVDIQMNDSSTGIQSVAEGSCDIGMASRELKDSELEKGLTPTVIAIDGIAVIANLENPVTDLTSEQVKSIYTGEITNWGEIE
ncbi:MAG TPA: substrate-binding domain-containing protein [Candidatus Limousia pullorum]|uniref:Substrate-binding domain-containing protein n=1 Tax=Candidatus Limousia pullorum TaxID=2840860 RepID=A0A9D1S7Y7_9FIRM|nr:substrate-binding domain-containing protein [Candidatus Limousia pullorum]